MPGLRDGLGPSAWPGGDPARDVTRGWDPADLWRWKCAEERCGRKTFTESLPAVPPRCRITGRLRELAGHEIAERGITPAEADRSEAAMSS